MDFFQTIFKTNISLSGPKYSDFCNFLKLDSNNIVQFDVFLAWKKNLNDWFLTDQIVIINVLSQNKSFGFFANLCIKFPIIFIHGL